MKLLGVKWFTNVRGCVGIVLYENDSGKERAGISAVAGIDEEADTEFIMKWGAKFPTEIAKKLMEV